MKTNPIWKWLIKTQTKALNRIYSMEELRALIEQERSRVDRGGTQFSLVVFEIDNNAKTNGTHLEYLVVDTLLNRVRSTDNIGWFDKKRIAVLLHNTREGGARCFARDFQELIVNIGHPFTNISFTVWTYPDDQQNIDDEKRISERCNTADTSSGKDSKTSHNQVLFKKDTMNEFTNLRSQSIDNTMENSNMSLNKTMLLSLGRHPVWKRIIDIVGTIIILIASSPFFLFAFCLIKIVSPGPVLYRQKRVGYMGKTFSMLKFRTMEGKTAITDHQQHVSKLLKGAVHGNGHSNNPMTKLDDHPHIIPLGKILRKTCIDELPQLINVLKGEMSLIGPRPPIPYEVEEYQRWHKRRLDVLPGLTGLWQVSGKNRLTFKEMVSLDIKYGRQLSIWLDVKILLMTPFAIVTQIKDYFFRKENLKKGV